jgi:hypothetical protein
VSRTSILIYLHKIFKALNVLFTSGAIALAEEEGIQPSVALTGSRQFSGLVTLATRPLLHIRKSWSAAAESNRAHRGCNSAAHHLLLRRVAPQG